MFLKKLDIQVATASEGLGLVGYSTRVAFMNCADGGFVGTRIMPEQSEGGLTRRLYNKGLKGLNLLPLGPVLQDYEIQTWSKLVGHPLAKQLDACEWSQQSRMMRLC
jgi:hypothetical protein